MQTIAHYNLLERLGIGALGDVYRARDLKVGRTVALMTPTPELFPDAGARDRFLAEARAATALNHPNIATLFDVVEDGERCHLAYEFAAGPSLRDEMGGRAVNLRRAVEIGAQIADALAEGHSRGLVHGDLRPENVVVTPKGSVKVLNFGLAQWTIGGRARRSASQPEGLGVDPNGVAGYLSPEQALGGPIDDRSDLFSFGVVLYEMVSGRNPFLGPGPSATVMNVVSATPPPPLAGPDVPADLSALIMNVMAKPVAARVQGALALSSDLRRIGAALDAKEGNAPPTELIPTQPKSDSRAWIWLVLLLVVAALAWWMF
jgi:eukaryotic-like serine/threonine-protein kinase